MNTKCMKIIISTSNIKTNGICFSDIGLLLMLIISTRETVEE